MAIHDLEHRDEARKMLFRELPSVNELMLLPACANLLKLHSRNELLLAVRHALAELREEVSSGQHTESSLSQRISQLPDQLGRYLAETPKYSLRSVINATGVILHTNLGRAPLSNAALMHLVEVAQDYCNLELDLQTGFRGKRDMHVESLVLRVLRGSSAPTTGSELHGVIIVNNCAAATILALNSLADKLEVIVSRGELVEIGGGFRVPEIMQKSGAILKEVGTTNRTHLADYERAIGSESGLLLRVHQSNFSIEGFAERPSVQDLVALSKRTGIPLFEDQGTGLISSLERFGINEKSGLLQSFERGVDLITASGDKLLGGPQCGLIVGRKDLIERIRKNPFLRAFRVDKLTYAALEATLMEHLSNDSTSIPTERILSIAPEEVMHRCRQVVDRITSVNLALDVVPVSSLIGGGTAPKAKIQSCAISLRHMSLSASELLARLRQLGRPIIGRIADDTVLLDLRTVHPRFDGELAALLETL